MNKAFRIVSIASIFYVIIRIIISICIAGNIREFLYYNVTNSFPWYFLNLIVPVTIAILVGIISQNKTKLYNYSRIFFPILLLISLIGGIVNNQHWGYFFKRPSTFRELKNANEILAINDTRIKIDEPLLYPYVRLNPEYYYYSSERPILAMLENGHSRGNILSYEEIFQSEKSKLSKSELLNIQKLIKISNFLDKPEKGYEKFSNENDGVFIEFTTSKKNNGTIINTKNNITRKPSLEYDNIYIYAIINSGQISNDHFGVYEFLFNKNRIVKKQKYYYDVAGVEYMEYPTVAPILELFFLVVTFLIYSAYQILRKKLQIT